MKPRLSSNTYRMLKGPINFGEKATLRLDSICSHGIWQCGIEGI